MIPPFIPDTEEECACTIMLPFPPASLSGHNKGSWHGKSGIVSKHRQWACMAAKAAKPTVSETGDIAVHIHFVPPDRRGDRTNFWNRCKAYLDGIAEGLGVNDARFLPSMSFSAPEKPGRVEITLNAHNPQAFIAASTCDHAVDAVNGLPQSDREAA